nr:Dihydrofolate reductase [uncultured bacterium]
MSISFLLAMDRNHGIGLNNKLPWRLPADLAHVKKLTMGHTLVMGRKTYESLGRPLPGRTNVVLTQNRDYQAPGCVVVHTVEEALSRFREGELFIFGGAEIFQLFMPYAEKMYVTYIDEEFAADTFLPEIDAREWELVSNQQGVKDEANPYTYYFRRYERRNGRQ